MYSLVKEGQTIYNLQDYDADSLHGNLFDPLEGRMRYGELAEERGDSIAARIQSRLPTREDIERCTLKGSAAARNHKLMQHLLKTMADKLQLQGPSG